MASTVDICNLALAHLGDEAAVSSISPSDGSAQADHCARFYPIARDALLEMYGWDFATRRVALVETAGTPAGGWAYEYAYPSSCASIQAVLYDGQLDDTTTQEYVVETVSDGSRVILTNVEGAYCRYTRLITDTTKYSPLFVTCLSYLLASYLAGPITKSPGIVEGMYKRFLSEFGKAGPSNANQSHKPPVHSPEWIAARGFVNPYAAPGRIIR